MDKETLSQYGWVVICVLVLAIMIAMATPFGTAIKNAITDTVTALDNGADKALSDAGFEVPTSGAGA